MVHVEPEFEDTPRNNRRFKILPHLFLQDYEYSVFMDDPEIMKAQIERYKSENYPKNNGLIFSAVLIRRHHDPEVIKIM